VWPGEVHFVDYLHPNATLFWKNQLDRLYKKVNFSGIWLDMNEPSNFRGGEPIDEPFKIQQNENLNMMTINTNLDHYNEHNPSQPLKHK
jgi:alpha-glucosidase (family GH31 glycosyl hydrolase)